MASVVATSNPYTLPQGNEADHVFIENLAISAVVGPDAWGRGNKQQQVLISLKWYNDISGKDDINSTLSYSKMSKDIVEAISERSKPFASLQAVMDLISFVAADKHWGGSALEIMIHLPKALLEAAGGLKYIRTYNMINEKSHQTEFPNEKLYPYAIVEDINAMCIIGINPHERENKQQIKLRLTIREDLVVGGPKGILEHWQRLVKDALQVVEASTYQTVEALAASLGEHLINEWPVQALTVYVSKPFAQAFVGGSGAQVTRYKSTKV